MAARIICLLALLFWAWPAPCAGSSQSPAGARQEAMPQKQAIELPQVAGSRKVPMKLLEAVSIGLTRNVELKKSLLDRASQAGDLALAERIFEPQPYLNAFYRHNSLSNQDSRGGGFEVVQRLLTNGVITLSWQGDNTLARDGGGETRGNAVSLSLEQPLLRGAGVTVGTAELVQARFSEASNLESFRSQLMTKVTSIQNAYWGLLLALENRMSTVRSLEASRELLKRNRVLIKAGRMAAADLVQTEQEVARAKVSILEQDFAVQQANRALIDLLDLEPEVMIYPMEGFTYRAVRVDFATMLAKAMKASPTLNQSRIYLQQAELDLKLAKNQARDVLNLGISAGNLPQGGPLEEDTLDLGRNYAVGLTLRIPLGLPRDRLRHAVTKAARGLQKAKLDLRRAKLDLRQDVRTGVNDVQRSLLQIKMAQNSLKLAMQKYRIERNRLELGRSSNFQVLSYQRDLVAASDSEHSSIVSYLNSLARLEQTVGVTLETWKIRVETPLPPKVPSIVFESKTRPR